MYTTTVTSDNLDNEIFYYGHAEFWLGCSFYGKVKIIFMVYFVQNVSDQSTKG